MCNETNILFINDQYLAITPIRNTCTKLNNILSKIEYNKLKEYILNKIIRMIMTSAYLTHRYIKEKNRSKHDLTDMIISEKDKSKPLTLPIFIHIFKNFIQYSWIK